MRGTTPLLAAYKNGHFEVVEWLLAHVAHLPSDPECNKALLAPMPSDTDLAPQRSKCIELIMKVSQHEIVVARMGYTFCPSMKFLSQLKWWS